MATIIADLVARIRADTTDVKAGAQVATQQLQGVQAQAEQTGAALEIMAAKFAKAYGGTAAEALTMFTRTGAQPTAAALDAAAQAAQKTAAAVQSAVVPTQAAATAATEVSKGWTASESSIVRFGAGLVGVGLGISLVAGAARLAHDAIVGIVDAQLDWERSLVSVHALYGALGPQILATAQAQAMAPGLAGSAQDFTTAALNARYLSSRYGLAPGDITSLTSAAGRVAGTLGLDPGTTQAAFLQFADSGGSGLRQYGIEGDPLSIARSIGGASAAQLQALTPQDLKAVQLQMANRGAAQLAISGQGDQGGLLSAQIGFQKKLTEAQTNLQNSLEAGNGPFGERTDMSDPGVRSEVARAGQLWQRTGPGLVGVGPELASNNPPTDAALAKAMSDAQAAFDANTKEIGDNQKALADANAALEKLGVTAGSAAFRLLGWTGSLEDRFSIAHMDIGAQAQASAAARAVGPNPLIALTPAELGVQARQKADADAYAQYVAARDRAANNANSNAFVDDLTNAAQNGPQEGRAAAQAALDDRQRRYLAATMGGQAQQAGGFAARAQTEAQSSLSTISVQQDERRLAVAQELANYRIETLNTENQMAPLLLQQAILQDRMTVAARDNLATRRELIAAQQAELGITQVTSAYDYEQQRLELRAEQSRAIVRQGGAATEDINALRQQYRATDLQRAASGVDIQALDASRQVQVVGQQRTGEQLARDVTLTTYEAQGRALEDQLIPLTEAARLEQAKQDVIARTMEIQDLGDTAAVTAAKHALDSATALALQAAAADRAATDMAAGMDLGATAAERWQAALEKGSSLLIGLDNMQAQQTDVSGRIAAGLGAGGIGPSPGQAPSTVNHLNVPLNFQMNGQTPDQVKEQVHIAVEDALNRFFAGASSAGPPAPSTVGGNGR